MQFLSRAVSGFIIIALTLGLITYGILRLVDASRDDEQSPRRQAAERTYTVSTDQFEAATVTPVMTAFGEIRSWRSLVLRPPVAGKVVEITNNFRNGRSVAEGDLLFSIDPEDYKSRFEDAEAALAEAQAERAEAEEALGFIVLELEAAEKQLALRRSELERQRQLFSRGLATESNVSTAELAFASAEQTAVSRDQSRASAKKRVERATLKIQRAQITLQEAQRDLNETEVFAPFSGSLSQVSLQLGQRVSANEQVAILVDPAALEAAFRVPNSQFARLLDNRGNLRRQSVRVELSLGNESIEVSGRIERIDATVSQGDSGRLVYASLEIGPASVFLPGDFVTVHITEPPLNDVSEIPAVAATEDGRVFIVADDHRLQEIQVRILRRVGENLVVKPEQFGATYVAERLPQLSVGVKVKTTGRGDENGPATDDMITLSDERRARLKAFLENARRIPAERRNMMLAMLQRPKVPRQMVERLESRMSQ